MTALRKLAINCNFGGYLNTALRNQFVFGLRSTSIQNRLLESDEVTIESALRTAQAMELSAKGSADIQQQKDRKQPVKSNIQQQDSKNSKGRSPNYHARFNAKSDDTSKKGNFVAVTETKTSVRANVRK